MTEQSYKILVAKRLAIDPNELLSYFEFHDHAICTTPDGRQHTFSYAELRQPQSTLQNPANSGVKTPPAAGTRSTKVTKKVAKPK